MLIDRSATQRRERSSFSCSDEASPTNNERSVTSKLRSIRDGRDPPPSDDSPQLNAHGCPISSTWLRAMLRNPPVDNVLVSCMRGFEFPCSGKTKFAEWQSPFESSACWIRFLRFLETISLLPSYPYLQHDPVSQLIQPSETDVIKSVE